MKNILPLIISIVLVYTLSSQFGIAFSRASTTLDITVPFSSPSDASAESPVPEISPSASSAESTEQNSTPLRYFDVTLYEKWMMGR